MRCPPAARLARIPRQHKNGTRFGRPRPLGQYQRRAREVAAWLRGQAEKDAVPWDSLLGATMRIAFDFSDVEGEAPTTRVRRLIFDGTCVIRTDDQVFEGGFRKGCPRATRSA